MTGNLKASLAIALFGTLVTIVFGFVLGFLFAFFGWLHSLIGFLGLFFIWLIVAQIALNKHQN